MNQEKKGIPFDQFKLYCTSGIEYTGDVQDFGYVYWEKKQVPLELPDDLPINAPIKRTYVTVSSLKVKRYPTSGIMYFGDNLTEEQTVSRNKAEQENEIFRQLWLSLLTAVNTVNSVYGNIKTYQSASTAPIALGAEYLVTNKGGTVVKNPNRVNTTKGKVAGKLANRLVFVGLIIDAALTATKYFGSDLNKDEKKETLINFGANTVVTAGLLIVGSLSAPAAAFLGVGYLVFTITANRQHFDSPGSYEDIHGSINPADKIRVHNPYKR